MPKKERRYDLDWWRVIAIFAVYLHHVGMPFNGDQFHIMNAESSKALDDIMVFFEQFRLPLLFFVSGAGTVFAFSKRNWKEFIGERAYRLLIPLTFGVMVIVPPQTYFEHINAYTSYLDVYPAVIINPEANHLWFIENLFYMSVALIPAILFFRSKHSNTAIAYLEKITAKKYGFFLWVVPLVIIKIVSKKYFPSDSNDITNLSSTLFYGWFLVAGIIVTSAGNMWDHLKEHRTLNLKIALFCIIIFYAYYFLPGKYISNILSLNTRWDIWYAVSAMLSWSLIITGLGYGQVWLNKKSRLVFKLNEAIYPFYVLHQTVIVILAYYIVQLDISIDIKLLLLLVTSFPIIVIIYRFVVYPFNITRTLFGMKSKPLKKS